MKKSKTKNKKETFMGLVMTGLMQRVDKELDELCTVILLLPVMVVVSLWRALIQVLRDIVYYTRRYIKYRKAFKEKCHFPIELVWLALALVLALILAVFYVIIRLLSILFIGIDWVLDGLI